MGKRTLAICEDEVRSCGEPGRAGRLACGLSLKGQIDAAREGKAIKASPFLFCLSQFFVEFGEGFLLECVKACHFCGGNERGKLRGTFLFFASGQRETLTATCFSASGQGETLAAERMFCFLRCANRT